jgi:hypothetical protein
MPPHSTSKRIELARQLVETRARMTRLRALLTARPISAVARADNAALLTYHSLVERNLGAELELHKIDAQIHEMRSMIRSGLDAVKLPSFRTRLLRRYDEPRQREKLRSMIHRLSNRKAALRKQIRAWNTKEAPDWQRVIAKIERQNADRQESNSETPGIRRGRTDLAPRVYRSPLKRVIQLALTVKQNPSNRQVCGYVDEHTDVLFHGKPLEDVYLHGNDREKHVLLNTIIKVRSDMRARGLLR